MKYKIVLENTACVDRSALMCHLTREQFDKFKEEIDYSDSLVLLALTKELESRLTEAINTLPISDFDVVRNKETIGVLTSILSLLPPTSKQQLET